MTKSYVSNRQNLEDYNKVFEKLCPNNDNLDIYGALAYVFYKKSKREYIANYKKDKSKNPTQKEITNTYIHHKIILLCPAEKNVNAIRLRPTKEKNA